MFQRTDLKTFFQVNRKWHTIYSEAFQFETSYPVLTIRATQIVFFGTQLADQQMIRQNLGKLNTLSLGDRRCVPPVLAYRGRTEMHPELPGIQEVVSWNQFKTAHFESAQHSKTLLYSESNSEAFPSVLLTGKYHTLLASDLTNLVLASKAKIHLYFICMEEMTLVQTHKSKHHFSRAEPAV